MAASARDRGRASASQSILLSRRGQIDAQLLATFFKAESQYIRIYQSFFVSTTFSSFAASRQMVSLVSLLNRLQDYTR